MWGFDKSSVNHFFMDFYKLVDKDLLIPVTRSRGFIPFYLGRHSELNYKCVKGYYIIFLNPYNKHHIEILITRNVEVFSF